MKVQESGMSEMNYWESLFNIPLIIDTMLINDTVNTLVEFGCGYGTFTIPAAKKIAGNIIAFDIDEDYMKIAGKRIIDKKLNNIKLINRDFIKDGTGLDENSVEYVMLFNILHHTNPNEMLFEAKRILKKDGKIGVIHWNYDKNTPRGPSMNIRLKPETTKKIILDIGFNLLEDIYNLPPYHYGIIANK